MQATPPQLSDAWHNALLPFFEAEPWFDIQARLRRSEQPTYPAMANVFAAFGHAEPSQIKAVVVGQDPYHSPGQAMGLAFSVPQGQRIPPSLRNIHKELHADLQLPLPTHGDLTGWARQGVLLLNTTLTVEEGLPGSHANWPWKAFIEQVFHTLSAHPHCVYLLWGKHAQSLMPQIDADHNLVITSSHPSPLGAYRGFHGHQPFSRCNNYLTSHGIEAIDWSLDSLPLRR